MKKTNFTFVNYVLRITMSVALVFLFGNAHAQCTLACNNSVQVSVSATPTNGTCDVAISADMILENYAAALANCTPTPLDSEFTITIKDGPNMIATGTSVLTVPGSAYMLNETYSAEVSAVIGGVTNSCWGLITIEDKAAPVLANCNDVTITCTEEITATNAPAPTAADNCSGATVQLVDESTSTTNQCGSGVVVTREYTAVDAQGNVAVTNCIQMITIERVTGVDFPEDIAWYCGTYSANNNITDAAALTCTGLTPSATLGGSLDATTASGTCLATTGSGVPNVAVGTYCTYAVTSNDDSLNICTAANNTFKIIRTWSVLDWCTGTVINFNDLNGDNMLGIADEVADNMDYNNDGDMMDMVMEEDNVQIIKVVDNVDPVITIPATADLTLSANISESGTQACRSIDFLPVPTVTDACGTATYAVFTPIGQANILNGVPQVPSPGLDIGVHPITYVATDACGNTSEVTINITVEDDLTPTAVCDEITQVALGGSGTAIVFAATFDDGSNDNCGVDNFSVRRTVGGTFGPSVAFTCADITASPVMVTFRVTDYAGLTNECMVQVLVEDKLAPSLNLGLVDATITCDNYFTNYAPALDVAEANNETNPAVLSSVFGDPVFTDNCNAIVTSSFTRVVNSCGQGTITRTFTTTDDSNNTGASATQTITINTVNDWNIEFPEDKNFVCVADTDELSGEDLGEPTVFDDDCELIAISVQDALFNVVPDACYKIMRTYTAINWCIYNGTNSNDDTVFSPTTPRRFIDGGDGIVTYTQEIKVTDDIAPVITNPGTLEFLINGATDLDGDCDIDITLPNAAVSDCSNTVTVTYATSGLTTGQNLTNVTPGTYAVTVTATDNCGNASTIQYNILVRDSKAPTPYCVGGLVIELMPIDNNNDGEPDDGMVSINATDYNAGSFDNCTAQADLKYFIKLNDGTFTGATETLDLTCANFGFQNLFLFVQDQAGNVDVCQTSLQVESVDNVCGDNEDPVIVGAVHTENAEAISEAMIEVNSGSMNMVSTNENGEYELIVSEGADVTVTPSYMTDYDEGVTTFDLVLIRQHILTTQLLDSPYKMIAADVNNSGSITASDLVALKSVILGMSSSFTNNTSWVFVDAAYEFPVAWTLQDGYPAVININNIAANANADFMAVKVGDINGSWTSFNSEADERSSDAMIINVNDTELAKGETTTVQFTAAELAAVAYQFTLNFTDLELISINGNVEDFGIFTDAITTSWANEKAETNDLFSLTFRALTDVRISEALTLNSRITKAEAYNEAGTAMDVSLNFNADINTAFALYQNSPNPVANGSTMISFNLVNAGEATLTLNDLSGKTVQIINGDFAAGYNQIKLENLVARGVYTYTLESLGFQATRKLIVQ